MKQSTQIRRDISKAKTKLLNKARKKGLWENFGQDEVRKLEDKHDYFSLKYGSDEERASADEIRAFDNWCANVNDSDLK